MDNPFTPCDFPLGWIDDDSKTCQALPDYKQGWSIGIFVGLGVLLPLLLVLALTYGNIVSHFSLHMWLIMFFHITSPQSYFPNIWSSLASFFRRRGRGSLQEERSVGTSCQLPQPATQMCVFPDSVPMQDILPMHNDFGAPPHYLGYEWDADGSLGHLLSHKDLRTPPPSYQGEINSNL
ncbi:hypothetical protein BKA83DRAFT_4271596 [Pisolithus microcarpus]|nr:hypothetical protein BKA83DRAFT_4271596 [Pisolithus microcarpus]